jgi:hypothetical protein
MKRFRITVDGHTYEVEIDEPRARPVVARIEGDTFLVDIESADPRESGGPGARGRRRPRADSGWSPTPGRRPAITCHLDP